MTEPLTRPLFDNRLLRATGAPDLALPLDQGLGAAFEGAQAQTLGRLAGTVGAGAQPGLGQALPEDQRGAAFQEFLDRRARVSELESALPYLSGQQRDDALSELDRLSEREILNSATQQAVEDGRFQAPEVLNEKYKDLGVTFDYAMSSEQAERVADARRAQMIQEAIMSRSPSGLIPTVAYFGAGLAAMATDPLEVATMFIPVVGEARAAAIIGRLGRVGGRVAVGAIEGGVGQAITEPLVYGLSRQAQLDYDMSDSLLSVGLGVAFGSAIGGVAGLMARRAPEVPVDGAPTVRPPEVSAPKTAEELFDEAIARAANFREREAANIAIRQFANDQNVDVSPAFPGLRDLEAESARLRAEVRATKKAPVADMVKGFGGIDPAGEIARILRDQDITPKTAPGLFRRGGSANFDNIPAIEATDAGGTLWRDLAGEDGYLDPGKVVDALIQEKRAGGSEWQDAMRRLAEAGDARMRKEELWDKAIRNGTPLRTREELDFVDAYIQRGGTLDEAIERLAIMDESEVPVALAENAMRDPLADPVSSRAVDDMGDVAIEDEIAEYEAMVSQVELSEEQAMELAAADADQKRASAFVETARAAALCVART